MLIGWKEVALELSYMQHDISHGSFKWLDWQCQLCQAAMYKYKKKYWLPMHQRCFKQLFYHDQHYLHRKSHLQWKTKQTK